MIGIGTDILEIARLESSPQKQWKNPRTYSDPGRKKNCRK